LPQYDLPLAELERVVAETVEPADYDSFWRDALGRATAGGAIDLRHAANRHHGDAYGDAEVLDVTFPGAGGDPIRAWFMRPAGARRRLGCLVQFVGYGGGRGEPYEHLANVAAGYAVLVMDNRAQGASYSAGATGDPGAGSSGAEAPGVMTRGISDPSTYYYPRLFVDAVRAVEVAAECDGVDPERIVVGGRSQGAALAIAAAAMSRSEVRACFADMPFLCDIPHALRVASGGPYLELLEYLRRHPTEEGTVLGTLAYVDVVHLARRLRCPARFSVGLMDEVCPPSTVFAAYNAIAGAKEMRVLPYNLHDGGGYERLDERLRNLSEAIGRP
jgi:cephalosporin-C deacetylase